MYLLKVALSEELKDDGNTLLKSTCGETKNMKHCEGVDKNRYFERGFLERQKGHHYPVFGSLCNK